MKKIGLILTVLFLFFFMSCTDDEKVDNLNQKSTSEETFVSLDEAQGIATKFILEKDLFENQTKSSRLNLEMVYTDISDQVETKSKSTQPSYYVFNLNDKGYVIVSADKLAAPILGYSDEGSFNTESIPLNMKDILNDYSREINFARENGVKDLAKALEVRKAQLTDFGQETRSSYRSSIRPLLGSINWDQAPYYNDYCPDYSLVVCVATASAQIMYYWRHPNYSRGRNSYRDNNYGTQSFDYNYRINWNAMQASKLRRYNDEIAKFCYGVAVSVNMDFGRDVSLAFQYDVPYALRTYYGYSRNVENLYRQNFNDSYWTNIIYTELDNGRPVQYAGRGNNGGHSFVCDGYDYNDYFHFNWGWGGMSNGYFRFNALSPGSLGNGGGNGGYNYGQEAVVGIQPA